MVVFSRMLSDSEKFIKFARFQQSNLGERVSWIYDSEMKTLSLLIGWEAS